MKKPVYEKCRGNRALEAKWEQDIYAPAGIGTLWMAIPTNNEEYKLDRVPKTYFRDLMKRADPETLFNQLLKMYLPEG